jgi:4-oxalocrotonate tautomerase
MPIVTIEASRGRTLDQKRLLVRDVTDAFVKHYGLRPDQVTIIFHELGDEDLGKAGVLWRDKNK